MSEITVSRQDQPFLELKASSDTISIISSPLFLLIGSLVIGSTHHLLFILWQVLAYSFSITSFTFLSFTQIPTSTTVYRFLVNI